MSFKRDQKFFDLYSLTIGALALFGLAIFVLAMFMSNLTQDVYRVETEEYQRQVQSRLEPFGDVYLPGDEQSAPSPQVAEIAASQPVAAELTGPQVYNEACIACHAAGVGGAPTLSDAAAWELRIEQGMETLRRHAVEGYQGEAGYMPPKGGRLDLSDQEVYAAVDYMLEQVPET